MIPWPEKVTTTKWMYFEKMEIMLGPERKFQVYATHVINGFGPNSTQKLAQELRFSPTFINSYLLNTQAMWTSNTPSHVW
jgi:hypothetical protein